MILSAASLDADREALAYAAHVLRSEHQTHLWTLMRASVGFSLTTLGVIGLMLAVAGV